MRITPSDTPLPPTTPTSMNIESEISVLHNFPSFCACSSEAQNNGQLDYTFQANWKDSLPEQIWGRAGFMVSGCDMGRRMARLVSEIDLSAEAPSQLLN